MVTDDTNQVRLHRKHVQLYQLGKQERPRFRCLVQLVKFEPLTPDDALNNSSFWSRVLWCLQLKKLHWLSVFKEPEKEGASGESSVA